MKIILFVKSNQFLHRDIWTRGFESEKITAAKIGLTLNKGPESLLIRAELQGSKTLCRNKIFMLDEDFIAISRSFSKETFISQERILLSLFNRRIPLDLSIS